MEPPKFREIYEDYETEMLQDAYNTILRLGLWDWLKQFSPHTNEGFMFAPDIELAEISTALKYRGHIGTSFGWTMYVIHDIAQNGWESHKRMIIQKRSKPSSCHRVH